MLGACRLLGVGGALPRIRDRQGRGEHQDFRHAAFGVGLQDHPSQPGIDRKLRQPPAQCGDVADGVERPEFLQQCHTIAHTAAIRRIEERMQNSADTRRLAINKVGIKDIRHPVKVRDRSGGEQHTIAMFNMYVNLPHNFKGTHMSRFVEILNVPGREISVDSFKDMLTEMTGRLEAESGHIEMTFTYFIPKPPRYRGWRA